MKTRTQTLELACFRDFDLIVVGGGIVGAGIAQDASCRGLSVLLIEKDDFAAGTSGRTNKLVHGNLPYLEQWFRPSTRQIYQERALLEHLAPHLIRDFSFVMPVLKGKSFQALKTRIGLTFFDFMAAQPNGLPKHTIVSAREVVESAPALSGLNILEGLKFSDAITDDSRLVLEIIKSACANGAHAINYLEAKSFTIEEGKVRGVLCRDRYSGQEVQLRAKTCVDATGIGSDNLLQLIDPTWQGRYKTGKSVCFMLPPSSFETNTALILSQGGEKSIFVVPWQRALLVGSTEPIFSAKSTSVPNEDEIDYLLKGLNEYNMQRVLNRSDVISAWAGTFPLLGKTDDSQLLKNSPLTKLANMASSLSPQHKTSWDYQIVEGPCTIISAIGGSLANYRIMGSDVVDKLVAKHPELSRPELTTSRSRRTMLGGWASKEEFLTLTAIISTRARKHGIEPATIDHLICNYGNDANLVLDYVEKEPQLSQRICPDFAPIMAEIPYCIVFEMAVSLEDILCRRIRLGMLHRRQCLEAAPRVAELVQEISGWDNLRVQAELYALANALDFEESANQEVAATEESSYQSSSS
jgi:glycerol-3-phosphate dehydrogenase